MQVDFYQLAGTPIEAVVPQLAAKTLESGERLLIVASDAKLRALLDEALWTYDPASFLPHGQSGDETGADQPALLSAETDSANAAKFIMLADGEWRDAALNFDRAFYLFDADRLDEARNAWRSLAVMDAVEPRYWKQDNGRWRQGP
ncbi:DNA polymerase III subunit chi [Parasphingopyxis lamellibrachiae]|uniref:DNA polymerase III chi subunit n=1 Tax=Parasphingopyxis lamellibrachiae TaxID=680125 RepID=A0A3D9FCU4_9SPHN|nr:DNA polymerase III subunit chi [Parasphingopyxis lamellibrachiae]RED15634.1 DNA polymerase III chi subunit [Parasphingopyxis lamellibrachiae]